jgi:hypothetical protein
MELLILVVISQWMLLHFSQLSARNEMSEWVSEDCTGGT